MPYVTSIERLAKKEGIAEGRQAGIAEGRQEGSAALLIRLARKRFAGLARSDEEAIAKQPLNRLEDLSEALLDFAGIDDLRRWLSNENTL